MGASIQPINVTFQATGVPQVQRAFSQLTQSSQTFNRSFVDGGGKVTAFGRQSVQALNAGGFALSQFVATGNTGFRSLATSAAGFASFFGTGGLIASGVISLGLILTDFWNRQRREIEETRKKVSAELDAAIASRREKDDPVAVAEERLATASQTRRAAQEGLAPLLRQRRFALPTEIAAADAAIAKHAKVVADALDEEMEALRLVGDARAKVAKQAESATTGTTKATKETEKATHDATRASREADKALEQQVSALVSLGKANLLTTNDLRKLIDLEIQYAAAARDATRAVGERAAAAAKASSIADAVLLQPPPIQDITETTRFRAPGPAKQITLTAADQARLAPTPAQLQPVTSTFSESFQSALAAGLANGVVQFAASGDIAAMWNSVGSSIVAGIATVNPWLAAGAGILQGLVGNMLGGGGRNRRPSASPLPIEIQRVITDPNFRRPVKAATPPPPIQVIGVNSNQGQRLLSASRQRSARRGLP